MSRTAWMIFGNTGQYQTSGNMPPDFRAMIQNYVQNQSWVIADIFCYPDTSGYLILGTNGGISSFSNFPADLGQATWNLKNPNGHTPVYMSWHAPGMWAVFCTDAAYTLGPSVPSAVTARIAVYLEANATDSRSRYAPTNLVFSPSGDWLLIGYDQGDEGSGTYDNSAGFPSDVLAAANALPDHTGVATVTFDPDGGWAMIDTAGNVHWGATTPADVQAAVQNFANAGIPVKAIQFFTIGAYTMPTQFNFGMTGPVNAANWTNQSVSGGLSYTPADFAQPITTAQTAQFGIAFLTIGSAPAGSSQLIVSPPTSAPTSSAGTTALASVPQLVVAGQTININPSGADQEAAVVASVTSTSTQTTLILQKPLINAHQTNEPVIATVQVVGPGWNSLNLAVPASDVVIPMTFSFTDDSGQVPETPGPVMPQGGNHANYSILIEQLQLDSSGNLQVGPQGQIPYWAPVGGPTVVDLWGPSTQPGWLAAVGLLPSGTPNPGQPPAGQPVAQPNQTVQTTVNVPVSFTQVQTALRVKLKCFLGDTWCNGTTGFYTGPFEATGVLSGNGGEGIVSTIFPLSGDTASNDPNVTADGYYIWSKWVVTVVPSDVMQLKVLPVALVYCPPGSASTASFQYGTTSSISWNFSNSLGEGYSVGNQTSVKQDNSESGSGSLGFSVYGYSLGFTGGNETDVTGTWDNSTTQGATAVSGNSYTITLTTAESTQVTFSGNAPWPGNLAPADQEPYVYDTFVLIIRPQIAIYNYPSLQATVLLGSWPGYQQVSVADLSSATQGAAGYPFSSPTGGSCVLNAQDCANLLNLDPFYVGGWQGAALTEPRFAAMGTQNFGSEVDLSMNPVNPGSKKITVTESNSTMTSSTESFSYAYNLSVEAQYSYSQMQGTNISFNAGFNSKDQGGQSGSSGGASGSFSGAGTIKGSTTNTVTNTNTQTMSVSYQYSNTVNFATAVTFTAQLSDVNPSTKTMGVTGPSSKSPTVLPVASTEYFSANGQIIINPNTSTSEVATIASIQAGTSFTLSNPLQQTHQNGEPVWPAWPYMDVFQFQDLILGGIAFQNPRATPSFASPYLIWQNDANGAWNWYGQLPNASSPVTFSQVATGVGTGNLQVIGLGLDGLPYLIWQNNANGTWNWSGALPNASSPVTFSQIATGVGNGGNLQVFGLGANDGLPYLIWQNNANGAWNWYGQLPNASSPVKFFQVATGVGTGNLQVVGLGANDGLPYLIWQNNANGTWNWYGVLPNSSFAFRRIATAVGNGGNLQVIALGL